MLLTSFIAAWQSAEQRVLEFKMAEMTSKPRSTAWVPSICVGVEYIRIIWFIVV